MSNVSGDISLIGEKIKEIRRSKKISQEKLAEMISMNHRTINRIENCHTMPTLDTLDKIAVALNVNLSDFFQTQTLKSRDEITQDIINILSRSSDKELRTFYRAVYNFFI